MATTAQTQTNFTAGEMSPRVRGRTDINKYKNGMQLVENFLPMREGGCTRRPGFRFVREVKDSSQLTRLIPFEFNDEQTYMLEFGAKTSASFTILAADESANTFSISASDDTDTFRKTRTFTVSGSTGNDGTYTVLRSEYDGTDTLIFVTSVVDAADDGAMVADIGYIRFYRDEGQLESSTDVATEVDSPYDAGDLNNIKYAQSNDIVFFAHPDYHPFKLSRTAGDDTQNTTWTMDEEATVDGPYLDQNTTATEMTPAVITGSNIALTSDTDFFASTDVGRSFRYVDNTTNNIAGWGIIAEFTDAQTVTIDIVSDFNNTTAETTWWIGAFSDTTGWPATVTFFDSRLWWGATAAEISTVYASSLDDRTDYRPTVLADTTSTTNSEGFIATISDSQQNPIRWMFSDQRGMIIMTSGGLHLLTNNSAGDPIGSAAALQFALRKQNNDPVSALTSPQRSGTMLLTPDKGERRTLQEVFTFQDERIKGTNLNLLADHVMVGGGVESAFQDRPDRRFWIVRVDGQLCCLLYDPEQSVVAWSRHIMGGSNSGSAQAVVESIAVISEANNDQLWAITKRTINGQTKRYVEFMEDPFDVADKLEDAFFVDSGLTFNENKSITNATNGNPVVITAAAHGFSDGDSIRIRNLKGLTLTTVEDDDSVTVTDPINNKTFTIGSVETNSFTLLDLDGTALDPYVSDGDANKEITTVTGLTHLVGETVNVMVDGASHPQVLVDADGEITLDSPASLIHAGLPVVSRLQTMPAVDTTGDRDSRSGLFQIHQVFLLVDRSLGGAIGTETGDYNELIYRTTADAMGEALPLFTGFLDGGF